MYIVNTSFMVEPAAHDRWFELLTGKYIPFLRERGFGDLTLTRVLSAGPEDHFTYSLQVGVPDLEQYRLLTGEIFDEYEKIAGPLFGQQVTWFTSLLKRIPC